MKYYCLLTAASAFWLIQPAALAADQTPPIAQVYETPQEFLGAGDFDGDGRADAVIVDKESGKFRLGYGTAAGLFNWVDCRPSGMKGVTGFSLGKLVTTNHDALVFTSPDANQITISDVSSPVAPTRPVVIPFAAALGPSTVVALDIGGAGNTPLADLYVGSIYNSPDANLATLLRDDQKDYPKIGEAVLPGPAGHANHLALKSGGPELLCELVTDEKGATFRAEDYSTGQAVLAASLSGLPPGTEYLAANFRAAPLRDFVFYKPGEKSLAVRPVEEAGGKYQFGAGKSFELAQPVNRLFALPQGAATRMLAIFGQGETAGLFDFDGQQAPALVQTLYATNSLFTLALPSSSGFVMCSVPVGGKFSTKYQAYTVAGNSCSLTVYGSLPSLADNDNVTIPDIYARIEKAPAPAQMTAYTNFIPGTRVSYVMLPIPGGEFTMGTPDTEPNRKPDEGPQHKVRISPFWMGRCEITWNEYELFMYPDEEKRIRATVATDASGDKLADAVTHPSRPYVEMSFGMGKDGFPAISMTQHAANKYCQWLSAKTGHFYRLPTEAEWEYACRAGTTTAYFFGDDPAQLKDYGWYEENSDFKYQKVAKKKPNPWGLCDMCGNVTEWVLDQYDPDYYKQCGAVVADPWNKATKPYPHSVRGGSWDDPAAACRSGARRGSDRSWKMQDPQLPKSVWYFSDAQFVGFRIVRPLKVPPAEEMQKYWSSGVERD